MLRADRRRRSGRGGFTLIEVLIAMVLLAIGLLALAGLGTSAVRTVGLADRNTRAAALASAWLEDGLSLLRRPVPERPPAFSCTLSPSGDQIVRQVVVDAATPNLPRVEVTVTPPARGGTSRPYTVSSSVFINQPLPATAPANAPNPCS